MLMAPYVKTAVILVHIVPNHIIKLFIEISFMADIDKVFVYYAQVMSAYL